MVWPSELGRIRVVWPNDRVRLAGRVTECFGRVNFAESEWAFPGSLWPSPTGCPKHPGRVRLVVRYILAESGWSGRMSFSRVTFNRVNLAESEWSGRMTEYDWLAE